ncbi:xanthine permease, partial [bacterium]|nr:xanthine permease [bacterium]
MSIKKPSNIIYGVDEKPPLWMTFFLGFQHVSIYAISLILPVVIVREMGGTPSQAAFLVSISMIAGGIGVIVQALSKGPIGSGYPCPQVCGPSFLAASIMAVKTGGLSLLFGMTFFAGLFEGLFSRVVNRLRMLFPTEVTGLIVAMVGITVIRIASTNFLGLDSSDSVIEASEVFVSFLTLAVMIGLNVWSKGNLKLLCVLIGMTIGYIASYILGLLGDVQIAQIAKA